MNILIMTIPISLTLGIFFLLFFLGAVSEKQFDDLDTPAQLPFSDDENENKIEYVNKNLNNEKKDLKKI